MKKDIAAFQFDSKFSLSNFFLDQGGRLVSGKEKLIQDFIIYLFTPRGAVPYRPKYGSYCAKLFFSSSPVNELDLFQLFSISVNTYLSEQESEDKILDISLDKISMTDSLVVLDLTFQFKDFQLEKIKIPFVMSI